jgi:hypothetical protein
MGCRAKAAIITSVAECIQGYHCLTAVIEYSKGVTLTTFLEICPGRKQEARCIFAAAALLHLTGMLDLCGLPNCRRI